MPRIPGVPTRNASPLARLVYWYCRKRYGAVLEPVSVYAHHGRMLTVSSVHEMLVPLAGSVLPANVRELVIYRVSTRLGCSWCVDFGTMLQRHAGLDTERLAEIDEYATSPSFDRRERLAIAYADAVTATPVSVTDEQVAELEREFGRAGVLELTYFAAVENLRTRINSALDITEQGFTSGAACRVPMPADQRADS